VVVAVAAAVVVVVVGVAAGVVVAGVVVGVGGVVAVAAVVVGAVVVVDDVVDDYVDNVGDGNSVDVAVFVSWSIDHTSVWGVYFYVHQLDLEHVPKNKIRRSVPYEDCQIGWTHEWNKLTYFQVGYSA
jgi:hypothetical protein